MKVHHPKALGNNKGGINKVLIGNLKRTKRKEDLNVLWYFDPEKYPDDDNDKDLADAKEIVINEDWGENFFRFQYIKKWVKNYWKNKNDEQETLYPISFKEADAMILDSAVGDDNKKALTLVVQNIAEPNNVTAEWKPYIEEDWNLKNEVDPKAKNIVFFENDGITTLVFKLDSYFFTAWRNEDNKEKNKDKKAIYGYENAKQNEFKVFKAYIEPNFKYPSLTFDYKNLYNKDEYNKYKYEDLYLVGRIIKRDQDIKDLENRVVIMVAKIHENAKNKKVEELTAKDFDFLYEPWTSDGPGSHGGSGDAP